jgi:hypothetical protein
MPSMLVSCERLSMALRFESIPFVLLTAVGEQRSELTSAAS